MVLVVMLLKILIYQYLIIQFTSILNGKISGIILILIFQNFFHFNFKLIVL